MEELKDTDQIFGWYGDKEYPTLYTVGERRDFFKEEGKAWRDNFFKELKQFGRVNTRFCIYTTENKSPWVKNSGTFV